jgi:REP element-mobilizing transposase RayT
MSLRERSSPRLQDWDYGAPGYYFVTICVHRHQELLGRIRAGRVELSRLGFTAHRFWRRIPDHHEFASLDFHVIMPNHLHGIVILEGTDVGTLYTTSLQSPDPAERSDDKAQISPAKASLGNVIRTYKGAVTRWAGRHGYRDFAWQSRYYDHIIRTDESLATIRRYIRDNPRRWREDRLYPHA